MVCAASTSEPHLAQEAGNRMSVQPNTSNLCGHVLDFGVLRVHLTLQLASLSRMLKLVFLKLLNSVFTWRLSLYKLYTLSICFKFDYLLKNVCHVWGHVWVHWQTAYVNTCLTTKARVDRVRESLYVSASSHFSHEYVYMCVCVCVCARTSDCEVGILHMTECFENNVFPLFFQKDLRPHDVLRSKCKNGWKRCC